MSTQQRGLGRGLESLFKGGGRGEENSAPAQTLPHNALVANAQQPRRYFADAQLDELAASIKAQGILQPILVRPLAGSSPLQYEIVAGERRWRAAKLAQLETVPVIIRELSDQETLVLALMENLQREDLSPMEEAQGLHQLKEEFGLSQEDLAQRLGKSRSAIANTLRLLTLPQAVRDDLGEGKLTAGHARALLMIAHAETQEELRLRIVRDHLSVREAEALAAIWKESGSLPLAPESQASSGRTSSGKRSKAAINEAIRLLQDELHQKLALPVTINGQESKGRVSIRYASKEELFALLEQLGVSGATL